MAKFGPWPTLKRPYSKAIEPRNKQIFFLLTIVVPFAFVVGFSIGGGWKKHGLVEEPQLQYSASASESSEDFHSSEDKGPSQALSSPTPSPSFPPLPVSSSPSVSRSPVSAPPLTPSDSLTTTFCVISDVPYNIQEENVMPNRVESIPTDCEFLVHLGDIKVGGAPCVKSVYETTAASLGRSPKPVFIIPGDNEWNDCPSDQRNSGFALWEEHFSEFENNWSHPNITVDRPSNRKENFAFIRKSTLFIGLNIVGGRVHDRAEWDSRLTQNAKWTIEQIQNSGASSVIIFGHAEPTTNHESFFHPLRDFIQDGLLNSIPILYLHGDGQSWKVDHPFFDQSSWLAVMTKGRTTTLKVKADPKSYKSDVMQSFIFDLQEWT